MPAIELEKLPGAGLVRSLLKAVQPSKDFMQHTAILAGSTVAANLIVIGAYPFLTRLYSASDFGAFSVFVSVVNITLCQATLQYEKAIVVASDDDVGGNVLALSIAIVTGISLLIALALWIAGDSLMVALNAPVLAAYWMLPALATFVGGLCAALTSWAVRTKAFSEIAHTTIAQSSTTVATQLSVGFISATPVGLMMGDIIGKAGGLAVLLRWIWSRKSRIFKGFTWSNALSAAGRYRRFPIFGSGSAFLNEAGANVPLILIASFYGTEVAGYYAIADRVVGMPRKFIGNAIARIYFAEACKLKSTPLALQKFFNKTSMILVVLATCTVGPMFLLAPAVISFALGPSWIESAYYVQLLALSFFAGLVSDPVSWSLSTLQRQDWSLGWDAGRLVSRCLCIIRLPPLWAVRADGNYGVRFGCSSCLCCPLSYEQSSRPETRLVVQE